MKKRLLALSILAIGLIPSIPLSDTVAKFAPNQWRLQRDCRERLGFGPTEFLLGAQVAQLRRCIDNTKDQYEHVENLHRDDERYYPNVPHRYEYAPDIPRATRRSIRQGLLEEEDLRKSYYFDVPLETRDEILKAQDATRRFSPDEQRSYLLRARREKLTRWRNALNVCRWLQKDERALCIDEMLRN